MRIASMIFILALAAGGCASRGAASRPKPMQTATAATKPSDPALVSLDQIEPQPILAAPTTRTANEPPLAAVQAYAQARAAQLDGNRIGALALLRKAVQDDPNSYVLAAELGQASVVPGDKLGNEQAIKWLEKALSLEP